MAQGTDRALRFAPDYGMFAAAADVSPESLAALGGLAEPGIEIAVVETEPPPPVPGTTIVSCAAVTQMALEALTPAEPPAFEIVALGEDDAPQMLALAAATRPGPFFARTHQLGDFVGVKDGGRLVAMAGERMKPAGFTEVSGVCTWPEYRGRGYAGGLMRLVTARILARGEAAFLHAYASNTAAIGLYESLGFAVRRELTMTVLTGAA